MDAYPKFVTEVERRPKRPRFQFRLRTLLIMFLALGPIFGYLAHEENIVGRRTGWMVSHLASLSRPLVPPSGYPFPLICQPPRVLSKPSEGPSLLRRLMGDSCYDSEYIIANASDAELAEARSLFPEAGFTR